MNDQTSEQPTGKGWIPPQRKAINLGQEAPVKLQDLHSGNSLPLVVQPAVEGIDLREWTSRNRDFLEAQLLKRGAILFRNFGTPSIAEFEQIMIGIGGELLEYTNRSTPRSREAGNVYTSTEYPANRSIPMHNELSYSLVWPLKIWFLCVKSAEHGGETPIADSRKVFGRIDPAIRDEFLRKKVMYVRNYGEGLDLPWQEVFQTPEPSQVEAYCHHAGIGFEWKDGGGLRTRQVCQAVAIHPKSGEEVWFNQAHLFHVSSLEPEVRESLLSTLSEDDLPRNACYGDGSSIDPAALDAIQEAYQQESVAFPWQEGDILMLDNMLVAHGRNPFVGQRKVVVGMAEPFDALKNEVGG